MSNLLNLPSEFIGAISGADYQKQLAAQSYQQALDQMGAGGTTAAKKYGAYETKALEPQFKAQDQQLAAKENAMGIGPSGAGKADFSDLATNQASVLAGAEAPLYSQGLGAYTSLLGAEPGAENQAYQQALSQFYQAAETAATGVPSPGQGAQAAPAPGGNYLPQGYTGPSGGAQPLNYDPYVAYSQPPANQNPYGPQP